MRVETDVRLDTVQILRALAALMIVLVHVQALIGLQAQARGLPFTPVTALPFGAGVDLFFVISGFIIVFASERFFAAPGGGLAFFRRRVCRIVPLWWFALSLRIAALSAAGLAGVKALPSAEAIAASYAFIPYDAMGFGPRYPFPVLDLGWSLNYEMLFYVLFALAMWLPRLQASLAVVAVLLGGVTLVWLFPPQSVPLWFWFQPIVLDFAFGVGLALLFRHGVRLASAPRLLLAAAGLGLWLFVDVASFGADLGPGLYGWSRVLVYGGGAALIVAGAVLGRTEIRNAALARICALGDSSYALYLLHPFVILLARVALGPLPLTEAVLWPLVLVVTAAAVAAAEWFHRTVEKPTVDRLQRMRLPARQWASDRL